MSSPPPWLQDLANGVALLLMPADVMAPIGCHFCLVESQWEVTLFVGTTEVIGGGKDGVIRHSKFSADVKGIIDLFSVVNSLHWQALSLGPKDELGAHLSIEGTYRGESVWLRVLATAPKRFKQARQAHVYEMDWKEIW